ncbi:MAG TPA: 4-oxalomesaconate tautomerase [Burkholderiales bacterium]|nr:4-oxalomesaconate tautomerase [Burkholderiales bacterium]
MQRKIPCVLMRGGTSRGPYFLASDLPADPGRRDAVLLSVMGSPHSLQVDGIGGSNTLTSKVAIVSRSQREGADVDYLFAQVSVTEAFVDTKPNCGNMLAGVGPFAIETGLVRAENPTTKVRIYNVNTQTLIEAVIQTPGGQVEYSGDTHIDGVIEPAAPINLTFLDALGAVTGKLLPTGNTLDRIDGIEASCVDMAMPVMIMAAEAFGKTGRETPEELDADKAMLKKIEAIRLEAGRRMGMGDVSRLVVPKPVLVSRPAKGGNIASRYFTPHACHRSHAVTGALAVATAAVLPGTVANRYIEPEGFSGGVLGIEHPSGRLEVDLVTDCSGAAPVVERASFVRTARRIFEGVVYVPEALFD